MHPVSRSHIAGFIIGTIEEFLGISSPSDRPRCHLKKKFKKISPCFGSPMHICIMFHFGGSVDACIVFPF